MIWPYLCLKIKDMKIKAVFVVIFLLLFFPFLVVSQSVVIEGSAFDEQGNPLDGNIVLLDSVEQFIQGDFFLDGRISLETTAKGHVVIVLSAMGFVDVRFEKSLDNSKVVFGKITLKQSAQNIQEVTVSAKRQMFEKTMDGTRVNVAGTLLSRSNNAGELLGRIPSVTIVGGKVNVFGRGEAVIYINGRETTLESFRSLPVSDVQSVEVLTNPDARYDAKGKAVVLVTMKKSYSQGISINLAESVTLGLVEGKSLFDYPLNAPNVTLGFRKDRWDFSAFYGNELGVNWADNHFLTTVRASDGDYRKVGYYTEDNHSKGVHNYHFGVGYKFGEKASLSAQYAGLSHFFKLKVRQDGEYRTPSQQLTEIWLRNDASTRLANHSANINYHLTTDSLGSTLFVGAQYNNFQNNLLDQITETIQAGGQNAVNQRINDGRNTIQLYTAQVDWSKKLSNGSLDLGAKVSHNINEGNVRFFSKSEGAPNYVENPALSNANRYKEYVPALYGIYKFKMGKKLNFSVGARWEHTFAHGYSVKLDSTLIDASYTNIFPSAKVTYSINSDWKASFSYNHKINRPLYQDLDPFLWYLDSLTSIQGNPKLVPELVHQFETKWLFKTFSLRYAFTLSKQAFAQVMRQGGGGVNSVIFTKDNIQERILHTFALEIPFEMGNYSTYNTFAANLYQFRDKRVEYSALNALPQWYVYSYHSYKIPKWVTLELTGEFYSASFDGFTRRKPYYYFTMGISRAFLKDDALNVSLLWNDLARTANWAGNFDVNTFGNEYSQRFTTSYLRLSMSYQMSSKTTFNYKNKNVNDSEFNRIRK